MIDWKVYDHCWEQHPEYNTDRRHLNWMYRVLCAAQWDNTLEIGCWQGASSAVFVEAYKGSHIKQMHFCDLKLQHGLVRVTQGTNSLLYAKPSIEVLRNGIQFDFVFVDGDHGLPSLIAETAILLSLRPKAVFAHDTSCRLKGCEGPAYLKEAFQASPGWYCLEDNRLRPGEGTERGLFFSTMDADLYQKAKAALA